MRGKVGREGFSEKWRWAEQFKLFFSEQELEIAYVLLIPRPEKIPFYVDVCWELYYKFRAS